MIDSGCCIRRGVPDSNGQLAPSDDRLAESMYPVDSEIRIRVEPGVDLVLQVDPATARRIAAPRVSDKDPSAFSSAWKTTMKLMIASAPSPTPADV